MKSDDFTRRLFQLLVESQAKIAKVMTLINLPSPTQYSTTCSIKLEDITMICL